MHTTQNYGQKPLKALLLGSIFFLGACATTTTQYNSDNIELRMSELPQTPPLPVGFGETPLSLEDARAMAVSRNAEYRQKSARILQSVSQRGGNKDLIPRLYAQSFGRWRSNTDASVGVRVDDPNSNMPVDFFTAQDRTFANSNISLNWSLLDLGLSGYMKGVSNIEDYDAQEQMRLGCHQMTVDVERAYWRYVAYKRAVDKSAWLNDRIEYGLQLSKTHMEENPESRLEELMYQRELIDIKRWYESLFRGLVSAEAGMAKLLNVPVGTKISLDPDPNYNETLGHVEEFDISSLAMEAYQNRPEIRRALYNVDKKELNNKQEILRHLPGINMFVSGNNDTNSFKLNQDFFSAGVDLSWNVLGLLDLDRKNKLGKSEVALMEQDVQVVAAAVFAQILLAYQDVKNMEHEVDLAWRAKSIQGEITQRLSSDFEKGDAREIYVVKEELLREMSVIREDLSRADLFAARARYDLSLGVVKACEAG